MAHRHEEETIFSVITGDQPGAVAIVRISGALALEAISKITGGRDFSKKASHTIHFEKILDAHSKTLDEALICLFRAPHSYTGEEVVEIHTHGSRYILSELLHLLGNQQLRQALPGEFTQRAYLNGKLDLSQAEAVADLIASETAAAHTLAINQLKGGIRDEIRGLRSGLLDFCSLLELELDFSEEDVEFADRNRLNGLVLEIENHIRKLLQSYALGNAVREGVQTVIAGRPNAGKSTLLNALLGENRAIVSDIPGTTRDTIEDRLYIGGVLFHLVDTAGIRDSGDRLELMGIERSLIKVKEAVILVFVFDAALQTWDEWMDEIQKFRTEERKLILVANKAELIDDSQKRQIQKRIFAQFDSSADLLFLSAKNGQVDSLKHLLYDTATGHQQMTDQSIAINARHRTQLEMALQELLWVKENTSSGLETDLIAQSLRKALFHLGELTGEVSTEEVLGNIFSKFCIGK